MDDTSRAERIIKQEYGYNSRNFMTPHLVGYGMIGKELAYEISKGEGFDRETIYGISVVEVLDDGTTKRRTDLSDCLPTMGQVEDYIHEMMEA